MTLQEYKSALAGFDWFYSFSDDGRVYQSGEERGKELLKIAKLGGTEFKTAYNEEHAKHFNTISFVSVDRPYKAPFSVE